MIFSPLVEIKANSTKDYYEKIQLENDDCCVYNLPYQLSISDLHEIQDIRSTINHILCSENGITQSVFPNVAKITMAFLYKKRLKIEILKKIALMNDDEKKFNKLKHRVKEVMKKDVKENKKEEEEKDMEMEEESKTEESALESRIDEDMDYEQQFEKELEAKNLDLHEDLKKFDEESSDSDDEGSYCESDDDISMASSVTKVIKKEEEKDEKPMIKAIVKKKKKKPMYFLNDLIYDKLDTKKLFEEGNFEKIQKEFDRRFLIRKRIKRELEMRCDLFKMKQCSIVCQRCDSILCNLDDVILRKESQGISEIKGIL